MPDSVQIAVPTAVPRLDMATVSTNNAAASGSQQFRPVSPQQSSASLDHRCSMPVATTLATPRSALPPQSSPRQTWSPSHNGLIGNGSMGNASAAMPEENTFTVTPYIAGLPDLDQVIGMDPHRLCLDLRRAENLHGFALTEVLSEGNFGKIHRATFEKSAEWYVREFPSDVSSHDIAREVRYFLRSVSPYVMPVKRIITDGLNVKYLLLAGGSSGTTLSRWMSEHFAKATAEKAKKPGYRAFADIIACVFGALYDLHQDAVIHGNLIADTIVVREIAGHENQFAVSLLDFNLASLGQPASHQQQANRPPPTSQHQQHGFVLDDYPEGTIAFQHEAGDSRRVCEATDNYAVGLIVLKYLCRCTSFLSEHDSKMTEVVMPADHSESKVNALIDKLRDTLPKDEKSTMFQLLDTASRAIRVDATATALNHYVHLYKLATKNDKGPVRWYASRLFQTLQEFRESGRCWSKSQQLLVDSAMEAIGKGDITRVLALDVLTNQVARLQVPSFVIRQPMVALMTRNVCEIMRASGMVDERIIVLIAEANHVLGRPAVDPFACVSQNFSPEMRARIDIPIIADILSGTLRVSVDLRSQADRLEDLIKACTSEGKDLRTVANLRFALADVYTHIGTRAAIERALFHSTEGFKYFKEVYEKDMEKTAIGKQDFQNALQHCCRAMERSAHSRFIRSHDKAAAATELMEAVLMLKNILPDDIEDSEDPFDAMTLYTLACLLQNVACRYRVENEATCTKLLTDAFDYIQEGLQILRRARLGPHFLLVVRFELQREMLHRLLSTESKGREGILGYRPDSQITPDCGDSQRHQTIRRLHQTLAERPPTNEEVLEILTELYDLEHAPSQRAKALIQKADFLMAIGQPLVAKRLYQTAMATFDRTQDDRTIIGTAVLVAREASGEKAPVPGQRSGDRSPRSGNRSPGKTSTTAAADAAKKPETVSALKATDSNSKPSRVSISTDPSSPKAPAASNARQSPPAGGRQSPSMFGATAQAAPVPPADKDAVKTNNPIPEEYGAKTTQQQLQATDAAADSNQRKKSPMKRYHAKTEKKNKQKAQSDAAAAAHEKDAEEDDYVEVPSAGQSQTEQHQTSTQLPNQVPELRQQS